MRRVILRSYQLHTLAGRSPSSCISLAAPRTPRDVREARDCTAETRHLQRRWRPRTGTGDLDNLAFPGLHQPAKIGGKGSVDRPKWTIAILVILQQRTHGAGRERGGGRAPDHHLKDLRPRLEAIDVSVSSLGRRCAALAAVALTGLTLSILDTTPAAA